MDRTLSKQVRIHVKPGAKESADSSVAQSTDEELMARFCAGDSGAFEELFVRHSGRIHGFIRRNVNDAALAEELLQEVFLRVVRGAQKFGHRSKFTTWLYAIARNQCIDALRRSRHRRHRSLDQPIGADGNRTLGDKVAGDTPSGERRAVDGQFSEHLEEALAALPDEQREVFLLRELHHVKFHEIAEITGVPVNTVKVV